MTSIMAVMNRLKRALGLPETISVMGVARMCPLLVFFSLLILAALAVMTLS